ncbi:MAG: tRNA (guanosine(46)-N7)-methyltransferase TrmB [Planctomycetes bacterium]|nr:tRNA (guanosine(46)-N7)-methyltransferase TrmB [Planctomycetota bacterium]
MGRRALRNNDPSLDLSGHLKTIDQLPAPWSSTVVFGRDAPLEVEVGSGKGLFLRTAAAARPDTLFLGIEVARKYARFAAAGLAKRQLDNARVVAGDALRVFAEVFTDASLQAVHVYFPDPWWKKRHRKRRVMRAPLLRDIQRTLKEGGLLHFWTDVREYFDESLELLAEYRQLEGPIGVEETPPEDDMDFRTHFERRMRLTGQPVYRSAFRKKG